MYIFYLFILCGLTICTENIQTLPSNPVCQMKDIGTLYGSRTCLNKAESHIAKHQSDTNSSGESFEITPIQLGVEIRGINLTGPVSQEQFSQIREAVHKYKLLIFKNQGVVSAKRHVEISRWFGELLCILCDHKQSPHHQVLRMSNDNVQGRQNVGGAGWHVDGSFQTEPFRHSIYHMVVVPDKGDTVFVPLKDVIDSLSPEIRQKWDRLWVYIKRFETPVYHPLIYTHPVTKQPTLSLHLMSFVRDHFIWDYGTEQERNTSEKETKEIYQEIQQVIERDDQKLIYSHKWEVGDFIITDNLALGHKATAETQLPVSEIGLRVLHRTTVRGVHIPQK